MDQNSSLVHTNIKLFRKTILGYLGLVVAFHTIYCLFFTMSPRQIKAGELPSVLAFIILVNLPYIVLGLCTLFIERLTPKTSSLLWPLIILMLGAIVIPPAGMFLQHDLTMELADHDVGRTCTLAMLSEIYARLAILAKQFIAAIVTVLIAISMPLINLLIRKMLTLEFWIGKESAKLLKDETCINK